MTIQNPGQTWGFIEQLLNMFYVADRNDAGCKDLARRNYLSYDPDIGSIQILNRTLMSPP